MILGFLHKVYYHNQVMDYIIWLAMFTGMAVVIHLSRSVIIERLKALASRTESLLDDFIVGHLEKTLVPVLYMAAFFSSIRSLHLTVQVSRAVNIISLVLATFVGVRFLLELIDYGVAVRWKLRSEELSRTRSIKGAVVVAKVIVAGLAIISLLDNLGVRISALIAGLGIGGVAVALASQAVLGDLFSFFVILFDRPFEPGDYIVVGEYMGTVEHIGVKTTRLRSLTGEQLIFSNTDLTNSKVRNFKRMEQRRCSFKLGVPYRTTTELLKAIPGIIADIVRSFPDTLLDRTHFSAYGDSSLVYETVYYVKNPDYNRYMDIQQEINFRIKEIFEEKGIGFATSSPTVIVNKA